MKEVTLFLESLSCPDCAKKIGTILEKHQGVIEAKVYYSSNKAKVKYLEETITIDEISKIIKKTTGYKVVNRK